VATTDLVGPLLSAAERSLNDVIKSKLPKLFADLLQPELVDDPPWADLSFTGEYTLKSSRDSAAQLLTHLSCHAQHLWGILASLSFQHGVPRGFLQDCCNFAFATPSGECARLIQALLCQASIKMLDAKVISLLCILAANAKLSPDMIQITDGGLAVHLSSLMPSSRTEVLTPLRSFKGLVQTKILSCWIEFLETTVVPDQDSQSQVQPIVALSSPAAAVPAQHQSEKQTACGSALRDLLQGAPPNLCCSIDKKLLVDPIRSPHGHVFERSVLSHWLASNGGYCPVTGESLTLHACTRDAVVRQEARTWVRQQRALRPPKTRQLAGAVSRAQASPPQDDTVPNYDTLFGV